MRNKVELSHPFSGRRVHQHGNHLKYQKVLKQVGIIYPRFPDLKKDKNHVGK